MQKTISQEQKTKWEGYFLYLDELRESGAINMFGARPYLQREFGIDKNEAAEVLSYWMASERHPR